MTNPFDPPAAAGPPPPPGGRWVWVPDPGPVRPSTNALAVTALVTSLCGLFFVAVPAGIVALVQIKRGQETGRGLAVAGIVVGSLVGVAVLALVGFGLAGAFDTERLGPTRNAGSAMTGTCLDDPGDGGVWQVTDCDSRHTAEVFYVSELPGTALPSDGEVRGVADVVCDQQFTRYVGESSTLSDFEYTYFGPDAADWRAGEHRLVCVAVASFEDALSGSVRGAGD